MKFFLMIGCAAFLTLTMNARAQVGTIVGAVYDAETGAPLSGCSVQIKSTSLGTTSDHEGKFVLRNVAFGEAVLVASFIGYERQERLVELSSAEAQVHIRLTPAVLSSPAITVIATRARERETPVAFATLEAKDLRERYYAQDIPALLSELPSTHFYSESGNGLGYNYLSIRGFDQRRISVLLNGVPQNDPEDHNVYWIDFPDLLGNTLDVQVQRGAGSAFYGPPAIGGSVNLVTAPPATNAGISAYAGAGSYATKKYSLAMNSGLLAKRYTLYGRFSRIESEGYRERSWVDLKSYFLGAARVGKNSVTRVHFLGGPIADHLAYYGISKEQAQQRATRRFNPIQRPDEIENFNQPQLQLLHEHRLHQNLRVNNTLFYMRGYGFFDYDGSWAPLSYFRLTPEYGFEVNGDPENIFVNDLLIRAYVDNRQFGWLPQLAWTHGRGEVVFGAELRRHRSLHWGRIQKGDETLPRAVAGEYAERDYLGTRRYYEYRGAKEIVSTYIHSTYRVHPKVNAMFDLQYAHLKYRLYEEKFLDNDFEVPYDFLNPRFGLNYNASERLNFFVNYSRTQREPRLKNLYDAAEASTPASWGAVTPQFELGPDDALDFNRPLVKPEKLHDYELGLGYRTARLHAAANFFYMDFKDEIIKNGQLDRFGQPVTGNAERTLHRGIELLGRAQLSSAFEVNANLMLSDNELKEYLSYVCGNGEVAKNLAGNPIAGFPNVLANARLNFSHANFNTGLAVRYAGKLYTDNCKKAEHAVAPYTVLNGNAGYKFRYGALAGLSLQLHVQNLLDRLYISHGEGSDFFPAAERQWFLNARYEL